MNMKVYVHYTPPPAEASSLLKAHTAILKDITTKTSLISLAEQFLSHYQIKHPPSSSLSTLSSYLRFKLDEDDDVTVVDLEKLEDGDDLFVVLVDSPPSPSPPPPAPPATATASLKTLLNSARQCKEQKQYKKARLLLERALKVDPSDVACLRLLSRLSYDNRNYGKTLSNLKNCLEAQDLKNNEYIDDLVLAAKCCIARGEFNESLDYLESATQIIKEGVYTGGRYRLNHAIICMAECHKNLGKLNESAAITEMVIKKDENFIPALINYADVAMKMGKTKDAVSILLTCIVKDQKNKEVKLLLAKAVDGEDGLDHVKGNLPLDASTAPAYAFLATILRDEGHIATATKLVEMAFVASGMGNRSYALNYLHALELEGKFDDGFKKIKRFLKGLEGSLAKSKLAKGVAQFSKVLEGVDGVNGSDRFGAGNSMHTRVKYIEESSLVRGHVVVDGEDLTAIASKTSGNHVEYSQDDYDLLAILFTVVKILYHKGNLGILPELVKAVEPLRIQSKVEIYRTNIRNENAYYMCASQLLAVEDEVGSGTVGNLKPIYVVGDSHTLSVGWRTIGNRLCIPMIVTGLKHWHLREESNFYPKKSFHRTVKSIPKGSDVIFIFGEIDCREGLILATEKDRYETHEEGMKTCIDIWMKEGGKVIEENNFNALIHPVIPVLEETREIVVNYNRIFKAKVEEDSRMKWIDVFEGLLQVKGGAVVLKDEYKLDGTHMNPAYLKLVERWMADTGWS